MSSLLPLRRCCFMMTKQQQQQHPLLLLRSPPQQQQHHVCQYQLHRNMGHSVRIIATENLPNGKCSKGEVTTVKAGYARNYLIPQKMAVYATHKNFQRLNITDPNVDAQLESLLGDHDGHDGVVQTKAVEKGSPEEQDFKAAELLRHYLRNKVLKIWRNVQAPAVGSVGGGGGDANNQRLHPGMVDARTVRQKLSKQLRIDLQPHEKVHLLAQPLGTLMATMTTDTSSTVDNEDATTTTTTTTTTAAAPFLSEEEELTALLQKIHSTREQGQACNVQIRQLGDYLASISLRGGHVIPLKVAILKR